MKTARLIFLIFSLVAGYAMAQEQNQSLFLKAEEFKKNNVQDSAIFYYQKAGDFFKSQDSILQAIHCYNQAGTLLNRRNQFSDALSVLTGALKLANETKNGASLEAATTMITLGVTYNAMENYDLSLKCHFQCLKIRQVHLGEYHTDIATSYGNIGNVFFNAEQYDSAIFYHTKALEIRDSLLGPESNEITQSYTGLGNAHRELENYQQAIYYFKLALDNKMIQFGVGHASLIPFYERLIEVYELSGDKTSVKKYQKEVKEIKKSTQ